MTSKADFKKTWADSDPASRRARLNELGAITHSEKSEDKIREHDVLAELVAEDEDEAARARTSE